MDSTSPTFKIRLGLFVAGGLSLFAIAIFLIGNQNNLFDSIFRLTATFYNVSGLQIGSNIRFSGINVGTVENIRLISDSTVEVTMLIKKNVQQFIKTDCEADIGSAGIIGDRILSISQGSNKGSSVKDGQKIASREPVEIDAIIASLKITADNAEIVSKQLAHIMIKINSGDGILGRLIQDSIMAENINQTIVSIKKSSKGLDENMGAVKDNFLFKRYFRKKEETAQKLKDDAQDKKGDEVIKK